MPREFKVVGKIDENTRVFGTTYGQVKGVLEAGFQEQFRLQEASQAKVAAYVQATHTALAPLAEPLARGAGEADRLIRKMAVLTGGAASNLRLKAGGGLDLLLNNPAISKTYEAATARGFAGKVLEEQTNAGMKFSATVLHGKLLMKTTNDQPLVSIYRRRVGEKDFSR